MGNPAYIDAAPDPKPGGRGYLKWYGTLTCSARHRPRTSTAPSQHGSRSSLDIHPQLEAGRTPSERADMANDDDEERSFDYLAPEVVEARVAVGRAISEYVSII
jgi:hypothetical protein